MLRPRWTLHVEAQIWRSLMRVGMYLHTLPAPQPSAPSAILTIPTTLTTPPSTIPLSIYLPPSYPNSGPYACLLNFHGGGFTLGTSTDDSRFLLLAAERCNAVIISVEYRLAPEWPFPTAVEDGADALLWAYQYAPAKFNIDPSKIGLVGWSAGGNMCFSVPLRARYELSVRPQQYAPGKLAAIVAFYPSTDFTHTREERRLTIKNPQKGLPRFFTDLFDASYLWPPGRVRMDSPYLSPGVADGELLRNALPDEVVIVAVEFDELLEEERRMRRRLEKLGKKVWWKEVEGRVHAWDKSPWGLDERAKTVYNEVLDELAGVFWRGVRGEDILKEMNDVPVKWSIREFQ